MGKAPTARKLRVGKRREDTMALANTQLNPEHSTEGKAAVLSKAVTALELLLIEYTATKLRSTT